jgi:uncharacterized membrane protein YfcA
MFAFIESLDLHQWLILMLVALFVGMSKTGVNGIALLVVPLLAFAFGARESTGIMIPILIMADIYAVSYYHRMAEWKYIVRLLPWAVAGILAGVLTGKMVSADQFRMILSGLVVAGVALMVFRDLSRKEGSVPDHPALVALLGVLGGFGSMVGNAAGPIFAVYLLAMRLPKNKFIGTGAWFFFLVNLIKLPFHLLVWKTVTPGTFLVDLAVLPVLLAGAWAGIRIVRLFTDGTYRIFVIVMTLLSAVFLFFR